MVSNVTKISRYQSLFLKTKYLKLIQIVLNTVSVTLHYLKVRNTLGCCPLLVFINSKSGDAQVILHLLTYYTY